MGKIPSCSRKPSEAFKAMGIASLEHITHLQNVADICDQGILNHYEARSKNPYDISNHQVQNLRERQEPVYNRRIHEYAPLYFNTRNPMLYVNISRQENIYVVQISLDVLDDMPFLFTDGNAAANKTFFSNNIDDLDKLPINVLKSKYWTNFNDGRRKMCSEVLIYDHIPARYIEKVYCRSLSAKSRACSCSKPVEVAPTYYF